MGLFPYLQLAALVLLGGGVYSKFENFEVVSTTPVLILDFRYIESQNIIWVILYKAETIFVRKNKPRYMRGNV